MGTSTFRGRGDSWAAPEGGPRGQVEGGAARALEFLLAELAKVGLEPNRGKFNVVAVSDDATPFIPGWLKTNKNRAFFEVEDPFSDSGPSVDVRSRDLFICVQLQVFLGDLLMCVRVKCPYLHFSQYLNLAKVLLREIFGVIWKKVVGYRNRGYFYN